jgi:hypothetical protein
LGQSCNDYQVINKAKKPTREIRCISQRRGLEADMENTFSLRIELNFRAVMFFAGDKL